MTLGGTFLVADGLKYDFCLLEALESLLDVCDQVAVTTFNDEDTEAIRGRFRGRENWDLIQYPYAEWENHGARERYAYWKNTTAARLKTDWHLSLEADEVLHESSAEAIREAIERPEEGFVMTRLNLWGDPEHYFDVEPERMPVGQEIIRMARRDYICTDDAQGITVPGASWEFVDRILIYHMGFVRDPWIMAKKIQRVGEIYGWGPDPRVSEKFNPWDRFSEADLKPIPLPLPKYVQQWAKDRPAAWQFPQQVSA